ncbi:hypothetical protein VNO77_30218 [Canavalia gladiata]|uniref:Clp R domain-containing protein n=1 Tax=Canavalia gladiata TaxID=3824 RepID=A0AAN9KP91_CANGL
MPTPVEAARQCLTVEAAKALDDAVSVARRRGHLQTTSLHAVSALLSHPSSTLRDACTRARSSVYSTRLQFKALELSFGVYLDRAATHQLGDHDPPVSNSLMAAIKRSQATQRRLSENFHFQQHCPSSVKVELQYLILSILDDPVVNRVLSESGFRSSEIKLAILHPLPHHSEQPSLRRSFPFRFSGEEDDDHRRIGEVLSRSRGRNPLLLGAGARDALRSFTEIVEQGNDSVLPRELCGLRVVCIGREVSKFVSESYGEEDMRWRFEEIGETVEQCVGPGVVVNFGDLEVFVNDDGSSEGVAVRYVVGELGKLLKLYYGKLWFMAAAATYQRFLNFVANFPSIQKEWDFHLLPIISLRSFIAPHSYHTSSFRCEPDVLTALKEGFSASTAADLCQPNLPPRLQIAELGSAKGLNLKLEDDVVLLNSSESEPPHKKLDKIYQCLHQEFPDGNNCPTVVGFHCSDNKRKDANKFRSSLTDTSSSDYINISSQVPVGKKIISTSQSNSPFLMNFNAKQEKYTSKHSEKFHKVEGPESGDPGSCNMSNSIVCDGSQMSPTSVISVTTDLGLGMCSSPTSDKSKKPTSEYTTEPPKEIPCLLSSQFNLADGNVLKHPSQPSICLNFDYCRQFDERNPKTIFEALTKEVSWQDEALQVITKTIAGSKTKRVRYQGANQRGDVWMNFVGPDRQGKKKIAVSLAEFLYGNRESFIFVDLSSEEMEGFNVKFRGKTILDFIVGEYCKKPFSVVFLENVDKADVLVQNSLSQAIKCGKLTDSHGREVGVNNAIFVTSFSGHQVKEISNYSEERIVKVKWRPIKITVEHVGGDIKSQRVSVADGSIESIPNLVLVNKQKLIGDNEFHDQLLISDTAKRAYPTSNWHLDLNLPAAEENELQQMNDGNLEHASTENQNRWLKDLYGLVDETVIFRPFNFDALSDRVLKVITSSFHKTVGSECTLEIESEVMDQLLAAAYVSDGDKNIENWVEEVLCGAFIEVQREYNLTACSIVKLVTCWHQVSGLYLPSKITID